jgi:hypothetical protein
MSNPTVTLNPPSGSTPSVLQLPDATSVAPNSDGTFTVGTKHMAALLAAGWSIVVSSGTTHVP